MNNIMHRHIISYRNEHVYQMIFQQNKMTLNVYGAILHSPKIYL